MSRKLLAITISMVFVLALLMAIPFGSAAAVDEYDGTSVSTSLSGSGTEEDPYLIQSGADLAYFNQVSTTAPFNTAYFKLTADIKWSSFDGDYANAPATGNWTPGGKQSNAFWGVLDGDGHYLSGIYVNVEKNGGLFSFAGGTIKNLIVKESLFMAESYVSAFVAKVDGDLRLFNCANYAEVRATVNGSDRYVGGFVALAADNTTNDATSLTIDRCVNFGDVIAVGTSGSGLTGTCYAGGLVGSIGSVPTATIKMSASYGNVTGTGSLVGGLFGQVGYGSGGAIVTVKDCYMGGNVEGYRLVGGITGRLYPDVTMTNCFVTGTVEQKYTGKTANQKEQYGAIIGNGSAEGAAKTGKASACYYIDGNVTSNTGVVSWSDVTNKGTYSTAKKADELKPSNATEIAALGLDDLIWTTNGIDGYLAIKLITIVDLYEVIRPFYTYVFLTEDYQVYATGSLKEGSTIVAPVTPPVKEGNAAYIFEFTGWEGYSDGMTITEDVIFLATYEQVENPNNLSKVKGSGTAEDPYVISSAAQLHYAAAMINGLTSITLPDGTVLEVVVPENAKTAYYKLTSDIDWAAYAGAGDHNWTPLANKNDPFAGTFDGDKHTISGIFVSLPSSSTDGVGLFAGLGKGAVVKSLILKDGAFYAGGYVASIAGIAGEGDVTILDCANFCTVKSTGNSDGGLVGGINSVNKTLTIKNSVNYGEVVSEKEGTGATYVGGIVGRCGAYDGQTALIENCANFGNVVTNVATNCCVGGIIGQSGSSNYDSGAVVKNCYNAGNVCGSRLIGGLVGRLYGTQILNSYNVGKVEMYATSATIANYCQVGPLNGAYDWGMVTNSYALKDCAQNMSAEPYVANGGDVVPEGSGRYKYQGISLDESAMKGASATANMKLDNEVWQTTNTYPVLKSITIVAQYNGEYSEVAPGGATDTTTKPVETTTPEETTTTTPDETTTPPVETTTETPVETTTPAVETTTAPETTTTPAPEGGFPVWGIVLIVVAVVAVVGVAVVVVIKKK